jgi:uncharacterized membrane protein required for colicin V production
MAKKPKAKKLITTDWKEIAKLWSVQLAAVIAAISGWYATADFLKVYITPDQFAAGVAVANLLVIVLRTLNQTNVEV